MKKAVTILILLFLSVCYPCVNSAYSRDSKQKATVSLADSINKLNSSVDSLKEQQNEFQDKVEKDVNQNNNDIFVYIALGLSVVSFLFCIYRISGGSGEDDNKVGLSQEEIERIVSYNIKDFVNNNYNFKALQKIVEKFSENTDEDQKKVSVAGAEKQHKKESPKNEDKPVAEKPAPLKYLRQPEEGCFKEILDSPDDNCYYEVSDIMGKHAKFDFIKSKFQVIKYYSDIYKSVCDYSGSIQSAKNYTTNSKGRLERDESGKCWKVIEHLKITLIN